MASATTLNGPAKPTTRYPYEAESNIVCGVPALWVAHTYELPAAGLLGKGQEIDAPVRTACIWASAVAGSRIIDHRIATGLQHRPLHRIPLPEYHSKVEDAETQREKQSKGDRYFDGSRPLVPALSRVLAGQFESHYSVRMHVLDATAEGKVKVA